MLPVPADPDSGRMLDGPWVGSDDANQEGRAEHGMRVKRVLVTGASGFIGRHIVRQLKNRGVWIRMTSRSTPPDDLLRDCDETVKVPDVFRATSPTLRDLLTGIDAVVHAAWYVEPGNYLHSETSLHCAEGTAALAKAAAANGVAHFVGLGTCLEYEASEWPVASTAALGPDCRYAEGKLRAFESVRALASTMDYAWCRVFSVTGPGESPARLVPTVRRALTTGTPISLHSGRFVRDYSDVRQVAHRIADAVVKRHVGPMNICSGTSTTIRDLLLALPEARGLEHLLRFGEKPDPVDERPIILGVPGPFSCVLDALSSRRVNELRH